MGNISDPWPFEKVLAAAKQIVYGGEEYVLILGKNWVNWTRIYG